MYTVVHCIYFAILVNWGCVIAPFDITTKHKDRKVTIINYEQDAYLSRKIFDDFEQFYSTSYDNTKK